MKVLIPHKLWLGWPSLCLRTQKLYKSLIARVEDFATTHGSTSVIKSVTFKITYSSEMQLHLGWFNMYTKWFRYWRSGGFFRFVLSWFVWAFLVAALKPLSIPILGRLIFSSWLGCGNLPAMGAVVTDGYGL